MDNIKVAKIHENKPKRLCGTSEQNKRFMWEKELFVLLKNDLTFWSTKITCLLESFAIEEEEHHHEDHDWVSEQIRTNTQPIRDICNDILGNYMAEIPLIISSPKYGGVKEAERRWFEIKNLYDQIKTIEDKEGILRIFREIKGKKHGTGEHEEYILQPGENRLSLLKSALDKLQ